ncbi:ABC transporter permease [Verrucomicrobiota bacterium]
MTAKPITRIRPPKGWISLDFNEMLRYRDLLYFLTLRDIKVKYKQTLLGIAWSILVPSITAIIFYFLFGRVAKLPSDGLHPFLFYLSGLVIWQYFSTSLSMASSSLVGSANLITKIYMPRLFMPLSACIAALVDFALSFCVLIFFMLFLKTLPAMTVFLAPLLIITAFATAAGAGFVFSALNVKYRDIRYVIPFVIQIWMFCSVIIPFSKIPKAWGAWKYLYGLNPMGGVVEGFRWCLMHNRMTAEHAVGPPWILMGTGFVVAMCLLGFGLYYFRKTERYFADIV